MAISCRAINAVHRLEKHGRLSEIEPGFYGVAGGYVSTPKRVIEELVRLGVVRLDKLGDATLIRPLTPEERGRP